jgi:hypothetical protein
MKNPLYTAKFILHAFTLELKNYGGSVHHYTVVSGRFIPMEEGIKN